MTESKLAREQVAALYESHASGVRRFLLGVLRDQDQVDEALQQTFVQVMEKGHTADDDTMKGWIYKVAFNQAMALRRRVSAGGKALDQLVLDPVLLRGVMTSSGAAGEQLHDAETLQRAQTAVQELPAAQREVLRLRFSESKTFAQIAAQLGIPLGTALTRTRLALEKLRRILLP